MQTMIRYKIICICLVFLTHYATPEELTKEAEDRTLNALRPPDKLILEKSQPYPDRKDDPSFMSKLANWIFPVGESETTYDSVPAAGRHGGPQYLPPPSYSHSHIEKDCNPCNEQPWVPIAPNLGHQTVLSFAPPELNFNSFSSHSSDLAGLETLHPPPASYNLPQTSYGAPPKFRPKLAKANFGLPRPGSQQIRPQEPVLPLNIYGPPPSKDDVVILDYMIPPPVNFKIPSLVYGPPRGSYTPLKPIYNPPAKPIYGPPPKPLYGPPKPIYGPPANPVYNPPPQSPSGQYGPPSQSFQPPPALQTQYGAPHNNPSTYLRPVPESYAPQLSHSKPPVLNDFGPPPLSHGPTYPTTFVDENTIRNIPPAVPSDSYGAPVTGDNLDYLSPSEQLSLPSANNANLERPIPLPNLSSVPLAPIHNFGDFNQEFVVQQHHLKQNYPENDNVQIQQSWNIADYLASIEHPINVIQSPIIEVSVKDENPELQELPNNDHSHQEFAGNYENTEQKSFDSAKDNLRLDSNEDFSNTHQSGNFPSELLNSQLYEQNVFDQVEEKTYNSINEQLHDTGVNTNRYEPPPLKLSENPIVVEDVHTAASNINTTFVDSRERQVKRTNDKQLSISTYINEQAASPHLQKNISISTNLIKDLLLDQERLGKPQRGVTSLKKLDHDTNNSFTTPHVEYGNWAPSYDTTDKPKNLQIIIPYVTNKKPGWFEKGWTPKNEQKQASNGAYTTLLPVYTPPSSTEVSIWSKFVDDFKLAESKRIAATAFSKPTTAVYNIRDVFQNKNGKLPYDIVSLQKNIDDWTHQAYSNKANAAGEQKSTEKILTSKKIPNNYFTTQLPSTSNEVTTIRNDVFDHQSDGSSKQESIVKTDNDIETNLIIAAETTTQETTTAAVTASSTKSPFPSPFSPKGQRSLWDVSHVTVSPHTKEKVYVVTPQAYTFYTSTPATAWSMSPKVQDGKVNNASTYDTHKFSIRVEPESRESRDKLKKESKGPVKVVFSEWPHLINNLQATTRKPTSRHPLFGLMDIPAYTPPPNATVETILGHSRVVTVVTPLPVARKKTTGISDKKTTIKVTTSKSV